MGGRASNEVSLSLVGGYVTRNVSWAGTWRGTCRGRWVGRVVGGVGDGRVRDVERVVGVYVTWNVSKRSSPGQHPAVDAIGEDLQVFLM